MLVNRKISVILLVSSLLAVAACGGGGGKQEKGGDTTLVFASYASKDAVQSQIVLWWAEQLENRTGGRITVDPFFDGTLIDAEGMLDGVSSGRADIGYLASIYFHAQLPLTSVAELPFVTRDPAAVTQTLLDLYRERGPLYQEYEHSGLKLLFPVIIGNNTVATSEPFTEMADIEKLDIRSGGLTSEALAAVNANPVSLAAPEIYESLQQGVIDGYAALTLDFIPAYGLSEVTSYVTDPGLGVYAAVPIVMDVEAYDGLSKDDKATLDALSSEALEVGTEMFIDAAESACDDLLAEGTDVSILDPSESEKWSTVVKDDLIATWVRDRASAGLDGEAFYARYTEQLEANEAKSTFVPPIETCAARDK